MKKNIRLLDKLAQRVKMKRRYNHGGPHLPEGLAAYGKAKGIPVPPENTGTITETDMSIPARLNRAADNITNFSMAPGGQAHGAPTQALAELSGVPSLLRLSQTYKDASADPSAKNIVKAGANTLGVIPAAKIFSSAAKGIAPVARYADDALRWAGGSNIAKIVKGDKIATAVQRETGGYMNKLTGYNLGGVNQNEEIVPGGKVSPIPGSDAVEFMGNKHDEAGMGSDSGILLDENTEVEDGETMDQVTVAKNGGARQDYFFSDHLKKDGQSYAEHHKEILKNGGSQEDIDLLARMQEHAAGRDVNKIAKTGGKRYRKGGQKDEALKVEGSFEENGTVYDRDGRVLYQDINMDGIDDQTQGLSTYHNTVNDVTRTIMENKDVADAVDAHEKETNTTLDKETNTYVANQKTEDEVMEGSLNSSKDKIFTNGKWVDYPIKKSEDNKSDKKKDNLTVASEAYLPEYGDIPGYQPGVNHGDMQYYMDDPELQKYITGHDDFGSEWMSNINPEVLKAAGITDYSQLNDPEKVTAYQNAWNELNPDNQIQVDGKFGEQTIRTGFKSEDAPVEDPEETPTDDGSDTTDDPKKKKKRDITGALVNAAQFLPAAMAFLEKPDYMDKADLVKTSAVVPERMAKVRLDRVDYNDQLARNASDANALNRFIETSGGGPASIVNRMAAYGKKQRADMEVKANETRANQAISNQEASLEAQRRQANSANAMAASQSNRDAQQRASIQNVANKMTIDEFNRSADAATKDRRLMAVDNAVKGIASMRTDKLAYEAQERMAKAISGQTGVYDREAYGQDLLAAGYDVNSAEYNQLMKNYNLRNKPPVPPKKKDDETTLARMGGYRKKIRRYGK